MLETLLKETYPLLNLFNIMVTETNDRWYRLHVEPKERSNVPAIYVESSIHLTPDQDINNHLDLFFKDVDLQYPDDVTLPWAHLNTQSFIYILRHLNEQNPVLVDVMTQQLEKLEYLFTFARHLYWGLFLTENQLRDPYIQEVLDNHLDIHVHDNSFVVILQDFHEQITLQADYFTSPYQINPDTNVFKPLAEAIAKAAHYLEHLPQNSHQIWLRGGITVEFTDEQYRTLHQFHQEKEYAVLERLFIAYTKLQIAHGSYTVEGQTFALEEDLSHFYGDPTWDEEYELWIERSDV